ncbi:uncharacterized protein LOC127863399 [Dreissena polymorpha]|uniref:Uncharacterized protein n=1 Tax=Dreissena polymorpha TaxID=45954 RepID=A0A9D4BER9_DREPO|nr:uncharacterized protein LOC127863399 [Dreissena polymorpha]KAH3692401.1 hypothetical protein DPMN_194851 [Dreissena polymorpha]
MRIVVVLMLIGLIGLCAAIMHDGPEHDSSEEEDDHHCDCRHHDPPPPPKDDIPLPEAEDSKDMDDGMKLPDDYENMSEEKKMELMEEHRKHKENKRCCRKHWHRKVMKIVVGSVAGGVVVIAAVITGCCCYHKRCKGSRTCPDQKYNTPVYSRFGLSPELGYVKEPLPDVDLVTMGSLPPTYTTMPMYGGGPGELILVAPPAYVTEEKKIPLP